jgi:hypothetical protein
MAVGYLMAMVDKVTRNKNEPVPEIVRDKFDSIVAAAFQGAGWKVRWRPGADAMQDFAVRSGSRQYVVEVKSAAEGRRDRLIPLLAQAILQAREFAQRSGENVAPLAVVAAKRIPAAVAEQIERFARDYAAGTAIGIVDAEGLRLFRGPGLESLNAKPPKGRLALAVNVQPLPDLFSDLNQWMLKVLLGQGLPASLISIPRGPFRNASQLAAAAGVSRPVCRGRCVAAGVSRPVCL